ncbi:MAG: hypothetical protein WC967_14810 [Balneolaceae bacterium]
MEIIINDVAVRINHNKKELALINQSKEPVTLKLLSIIKRKLNQISKEANEYSVAVINAV